MENSESSSISPKSICYVAHRSYSGVKDATGLRNLRGLPEETMQKGGVHRLPSASCGTARCSSSGSAPSTTSPCAPSTRPSTCNDSLRCVTRQPTPSSPSHRQTPPFTRRLPPPSSTCPASAPWQGPRRPSLRRAPDQRRRRRGVRSTALGAR